MNNNSIEWADYTCNPVAGPRDGRITVALPGVVISPLPFSTQISQST